jgi:hypothetical protein
VKDSLSSSIETNVPRVLALSSPFSNYHVHLVTSIGELKRCRDVESDWKYVL